MEITKSFSINPNYRNKYMMDFQVLSRKQVEFGIQIIAYRNAHNLSQQQFASIASVYGRPYRIKVSQADVSSFELFKRIPSEKKMFAILSAMNLDIEDLVA